MTDVVTMFIVTAVSLLLLVYVGFAEGRRVYEQFHLETLTSEGRAIQNIIENYLRVGLPLHQYAGFSNVADPIAQFPEIDAIVVYDAAGQPLFKAVDKNRPMLPETSSVILHPRDNVVTEIGPTHYQTILPLRTRFETVGSVVLFGPTDIVSQRLESSFSTIVYGALGLSVAFALFLFFGAPYFLRSRTPWLQIGYAFVFFSMTGVVVGTLVNLYSDGIQGKANSSATVLAQRLSDIVNFKLRFRDIDGLDKTFSEYRRLNPDISSASLITDGVVRISTDSDKMDKAWVHEPRTYEVKIKLSGPELAHATLIVTGPISLVYEQVVRSVRNFAVLFVACGFLAGLFLQVATSMLRLRLSGGADKLKLEPNLNNETALIIVKPIFFLAVFLENLTYSFLPNFVQKVAEQSGMSVNIAIIPFVAYYLSFALTLIPAGYIADRRGPKVMICAGAVLAGLSLFGLAVHLGILSLTACRALAGIGQAMLFIGIQSYILAVTPPEKKTQGAGIIVFGFQGGMIAGMAIGSLLVVYLQPHGVFMLSGGIGIVTAIYSLLLIPNDRIVRNPGIGIGKAVRQVVGELGQVIRNTEFVRTMICIGVPAKAVLTGVITFAIPLLLGKQGYKQEDIGQILMLYGIGVVGASLYASRLVDRTGNSEMALFWGAAASGIGLVLVGIGGSSSIADGTLGTFVVVLGVIIIGGAHGFINAPVITHVAQSELAMQIGANPVATAYRFLERVGHIAGPLLLGQAFILWGENAHILAWIGFIATGLGFVFLIGSVPPKRSGFEPEVAK
jgi:MFS family permease